MADDKNKNQDLEQQEMEDQDITNQKGGQGSGQYGQDQSTDDIGGPKNDVVEGVSDEFDSGSGENW